MKRIRILMCVFLIIVLSGCSLFTKGDKNLKLNIDNYDGYISSCVYGDGYCLLDSKGLITVVSAIGETENVIYNNEDNYKLCDITSFNNKIIAVGRAGALLLLDDKNSVKNFADKYDDNDFISVCSTENGVCVGCGNGDILRIKFVDNGFEYSLSETKVKSPVISVAYSDNVICAVTNDGTGIYINNGQIAVHKFSEFYPGEYRINDITFGETMFECCGIQTDNNTAVVFYTNNGNIWMKKSIEFFEDNKVDFPEPLELYSIAFDGTQFVSGANNGYVVTLPDCAKCNKLNEVFSGKVYTVSSNKKSVVCAGTEKKIKAIATDEVRQSNISVETAKEYIKNGGVLIDVRNAEDYNKNHIDNAINIPLDNLEQLLPQKFPDKNTLLVFYCAMGVRSSSAVEKAIKLGYERAYSMGAMSSWS